MKARPIEEQIAYLRKGLAELIQEDELRERLKLNRPLRVKLGLDPTAPDLHLGHTVVLRKLKHFQDLGHTVIFLIGDFTSRIGDPSGRNATRPPMSREEIEANAATYRAQASKVLDPERTEIRYNSEWLGAMKFDDVIRLCARYTVARILERDDFSTRYRGGQPISVHELLYPLAQAYDSVALRADIEMGGTDQKFNLLVGREIQKDFGQPPQIVATTPILEGLDGVQKMSKSLGNYIGITEPAEVMYRKVMSISDDLMWSYYELLTDLSAAEIAALRQESHPMEAKKDLARRIATDFHSASAAERAAGEFRRVVQQGEAPAEIPTVELPASMRGAAKIPLHKLLAQVGLAESVTEATRKLKAGAVSIDGRRHERLDFEPARIQTEVLIQVGKSWRRVKLMPDKY